MQQPQVNISIEEYVSFRLGEKELSTIRNENERLIKENEKKKEELNALKKLLENKRIEVQNASREYAKIRSSYEINKEVLKQINKKIGNTTIETTEQVIPPEPKEIKMEETDEETIEEQINKFSMIESERDPIEMTDEINDDDTIDDKEEGDSIKKIKLRFTVRYDLLLTIFCDKLEKREDVKILKGYPSIRSSILFTDYCKAIGVKFPSCIRNENQKKCFVRINVGNFNKCITKLESARISDGYQRNLLVIKDRYPHVQYVAAGRIDI
ncbi:hypothetical protein EDI_023430 [Entamoeba dispar SAW760]|uniref:Uncharacterized protein n=1 Tax=Entamoeba dispar (strain ATCC PRA-260 / SAW760) TaxID=370354 RepID=B0EH87_ENTDS|nr:uncharacterized protein EDI_023430 [Entamoeba dispar SAW760]EDR26080.1 hypothetical protein EDI_023430 [Entamoeba dispar SAW760]|eukprot:EDR26080.1 hypothetical protein EDI_023430 [Entamoeba dispar SAW760]